jgi:hypothetical protein
MADHVENASSAMEGYRKLKRETDLEAAELEQKAAELRASVIKPDVTPFISDSVKALENYKAEARKKLGQCVRSADFMRKYQIDATLAASKIRGHTTLESVLTVPGADALLLMMAAGVVSDCEYLGQLFGTHKDNIFQPDRIKNFASICERFGFIEKELDNVMLEEEFLSELRLFARFKD